MAKVLTARAEQTSSHISPALFRRIELLSPSGEGSGVSVAGFL
jgi:hypothetical protein